MKGKFLLFVLLLAVGQASYAIEVSLPILTGKAGDTLDVPLSTTPVPDSSILSYQFTLVYSPNVVTVLSIVTQGTMVDKPGWSAIENITADSVTIGAYGSTYLSGQGTILKVRCILKGAVGSNSSLVLRRFMYNAGTPVVTMKDGAISVVTVVPRATIEKPAVSRLEQNYPNPFNPATVIPYVLDRGAQVQVNIFSSLGQTMGTLVDQYQDAGEYRIRFDGTGLPSGTYFVQLRAGAAVFVLPMVLMR